VPGVAGRHRGDGAREDDGTPEAGLRLVVDPDRPTGRILLAEGVPQSYVDPTDPGYLHFEYVRRMATVLDAVAPEGVAVDALHLGGGALTLPRYLAATRPGSRQLVVEREATVIDLVCRELPPPAGALRIRHGDARAVLHEQPPGSYDLVVVDVYQGAVMPRPVGTAGFVAAAARVLRPDGLYVVNLTDLPPLAFSRRQVATVATAFAECCLIAGRAMLRARRYGNIVLAAAGRPGRLPVRRLDARAARDAVAGRVLSGPELRRWAADAAPLLDPPG
jgi:spermidine synthase